MKYLKYFYYLAAAPAYMFFKYFAIRNQFIREDFIVNRKYHSKPDMSDYVAFCHMMQKLPEYRFVLYNRMPVICGAFLNILLPKRRVVFNINSLMGGGTSYTRMVYNSICRFCRYKLQGSPKLHCW